uniref:Uncharacterized protein n=1 Tax=Anguilla anguilla TaxID=7936 RepID=A0A0E9RMC8_ANGAN
MDFHTFSIYLQSTRETENRKTFYHSFIFWHFYATDFLNSF